MVSSSNAGGVDASEVTFGKPEPFDITVPQSKLDLLQKHVELADVDAFAANCLEENSDDQADYGLPPQFFRALVEHLKAGKFDWRRTEQTLRELGEHLRVPLRGVRPGDDGVFNMHVVHRRSSNPDAIPLLLCHGWPGNVLEFKGIAALLTDGSPAFHVVMPSLPGYAWSDAPRKAPGRGLPPWSQRDSHRAMHGCMLALGYETYVSQGGDWGSLMARGVAQIAPARVKAVHVNFMMGGLLPKPTMLSDEEKRGYHRRDVFVSRASGYGAIQEKLYRWCAPDSQPSLDDVLSISLVYWMTGKITSSFWHYFGREHPDGDQPVVSLAPLDQPAAVAYGAYELYWPAESAVAPLFPHLASYRVLEKGGHFLAMEQPELLAQELRRHFGAHWP